MFWVKLIAIKYWQNDSCLSLVAIRHRTISLSFPNFIILYIPTHQQVCDIWILLKWIFVTVSWSYFPNISIHFTFISMVTNWISIMIIYSQILYANFFPSSSNLKSQVTIGKEQVSLKLFTNFKNTVNQSVFMDELSYIRLLSFSRP